MKGKRGNGWEKNAKKQRYGNHIDKSQILSYYYNDAGDLITQPFTVFFYYTKTKSLNKFTDFLVESPSVLVTCRVMGHKIHPIGFGKVAFSLDNDMLCCPFDQMSSRSPLERQTLRWAW